MSHYDAYVMAYYQGRASSQARDQCLGEGLLNIVLQTQPV